MSRLSEFQFKNVLFILEVTFLLRTSQCSVISKRVPYVTQEERNALMIPNEHKCTIWDKTGWKCSGCNNIGGCCIELEWICDGYHQCMWDDSDEVEGCALVSSVPTVPVTSKKIIHCFIYF